MSEPPKYAYPYPAQGNLDLIHIILFKIFLFFILVSFDLGWIVL